MMSKKELERALQDYVTATEAAAMLGIYSGRVRQLLRNGRLDGIKIGNAWIVSRDSIAQYQRSKSPKGRPPSGTRTKVPIDK